MPDEYFDRSRLRPRSKTRRVGVDEVVSWCVMRKHMLGTSDFLSGSASVIKRRSGRVSWPPWRAETET